MTFLNLLTNQIIVSRLDPVSGDKTSYASTITLDVCIQRMSDVATVAIGGSIGKTFRLYAEINDDIRKGDRIKDTSTGNEYRVKGVSIPANLGNFEHLEIVIERLK